MRGLMMDVPLMISSILEHASRFTGDQEIITRTVEGPIHRYTYRDLAARSAQLAYALRALGVEPSDRVATLAWNTYRHVELYYGVAGIGAVCHTVNPRLYRDQIAYIMNHADDGYVFVDLTFVPLLEALAPQLPRVRGYVILTGEDTMPPTPLPGALCYETLIAGRPTAIDWPLFDEYTASGLCYTSGTTGDPKGVLYSHRSTVLHALVSAIPESSRRRETTACMMPIVPMYHVNGWGYPHVAPMMGAKLVLAGPAHDGESLYQLIETEGVQIAAGVPTVWQGLLDYMTATGKELTALHVARIGGSAAPPAMIDAFERRGIEVTHGWGMTETSPLCTNGSIARKHRDAPNRMEYQRKAGRSLFGTQMRVVDESDNVVRDDGVSRGELQVRGPWIAGAYYENEPATRAQFTDDGWFKTGDIMSLDADGYLTVHDRSKDVIKSGGEWISSIDLENAAVGHPDIAEAGAIAIPHPRWGERPLLVVVRRPGNSLDAAGVLAYLQDKVAKWWLPDEVVFVDEMPHTATGKISKKALRERYAAGVLSTSS
jgi:fatty-acyl-CoA synthase